MALSAPVVLPKARIKSRRMEIMLNKRLRGAGATGALPAHQKVRAPVLVLFHLSQCTFLAHLTSFWYV
jgi:hypothetical protein